MAPTTSQYYKLLIFNAYKKISKDHASPISFTTYHVKNKDSFWNIAKKKGIFIDSIISLNNPEKAHFIQINNQVKIPNVDGIWHEKESLLKENLNYLASNYNTSKKVLAYFNPNHRDTNQIFIPNATFSLAERSKKLGYLFLKPIFNIRITSTWGIRIHPITKKRDFHSGVDIAGNKGTTVYSSKGGTVVFAGYAFGYGKLIVIKHANNYKTKYAHLSSILVKAGQKISSQYPIGKVGTTGRSTGYHLHFEILKKGKSVNPLDLTELY